MSRIASSAMMVFLKPFARNVLVEHDNAHGTSKPPKQNTEIDSSALNSANASSDALGNRKANTPTSSSCCLPAAEDGLLHDI